MSRFVVVTREPYIGQVEPVSRILPGLAVGRTDKTPQPDIAFVEASLDDIHGLRIRLGSAYDVVPESAWSPGHMAA